MKIIKTIPVYDKKGRRLTSIEESDYEKISHEDETFFDVQSNFLIIKDRFFRSPHLVRPWTFWMHGEQVLSSPDTNRQYKKVLFILESPGKNEFDYSNDFKAGKPLSRKTYTTFKATFQKLMKLIDNDSSKNFEVCFYNMVPFQISLYYLLKKGTHKLTRYNFWLTAWWNQRYEREFKAFMEKNSFDFCINASARLFKDVISKELSKVVPIEYQVHHPNSNHWRRKEANFGLKKVIHKEEHKIFAN